MVGYLSLEGQVDKDFSFEDIRKIPGAAMGRIYRGLKTVPVAQIGAA
jgi:hypothetical protein